MIVDWEHGAVVVAVAGVAGVALLMFFTGANKALRSAGERETRLIAWALFRVGLGAALWWVFHHPPPDVAVWVFLARALVPYSEMIVMVLALWLGVTGATRLPLILWGGLRAEKIIRRVLQQRNAPLVPARRRFFR